jgi:hypothetical protein
MTESESRELQKEKKRKRQNPKHVVQLQPPRVNPTIKVIYGNAGSMRTVYANILQLFKNNYAQMTPKVY